MIGLAIQSTANTRHQMAVALIGLTVSSAHVHLRAGDWSAGITALVISGLLVFLIGAHKEHGANDKKGPVVHELPRLSRWHRHDGRLFRNGAPRPSRTRDRPCFFPNWTLVHQYKV